MRRRYAGWPMVGMVAAVLALITTLCVPSVPVLAADQVVTNCSDDAQFSSLLAGGGTITFDCGTALLHLSSPKLITAETTIDGGGHVTLSGDNARQLFVVSSGVGLTLRNIVLTNGFSSQDGGAIVNNGAVTLENSTVRNSEASASGGAIVSYGPLHIMNSLLEGNRAHNGGALYPRWSNAQTVIVGSVLRNNRASTTNSTTEGYGGAILSWDGAVVTIGDSDISGNTAQRGGGIYNWSNSVLFLGGTRLRGNAASGSGGGITNRYDARMTLTNSTLSGNSSSSVGGGIENWGTATLTNITLSGNSADDAGGGMYNQYQDSLTLTNVTLSGNAAGHEGGGIINYGGAVTIKNSIVANTLSGGNCAGVLTNGGFNLSSDSSCDFGLGRDAIDVMLGPLADNGGPTQTHMPQAGSPVIDHGSACPDTDQRGVSQPQGPACDIGAVEYAVIVSPPGNGAPSPTPTPTPGNGNPLPGKSSVYLPLVVR